MNKNKLDDNFLSKEQIVSYLHGEDLGKYLKKIQIN